MVDITIVNGVYKPTYNWGAPSCLGDVRLPCFILTGCNHKPSVEGLCGRSLARCNLGCIRRKSNRVHVWDATWCAPSKNMLETPTICLSLKIVYPQINWCIIMFLIFILCFTGGTFCLHKLCLVMPWPSVLPMSHGSFPSFWHTELTLADAIWALRFPNSSLSPLTVGMAAKLHLVGTKLSSSSLHPSRGPLKTFPNSAISASAKTYQYIMQLYICIYPNSLSLYNIYISQV